MPRGGLRSTSFKPGKSGNPTGKAKNPEKIISQKVLADVKLLAKQAGEEAIAALKEVMADKKSPPAARVAAATSILDRGYGKPSQTIDANVSLLDKMTDAEQRALLSVFDAIEGDEAQDSGGASGTTH